MMHDNCGRDAVINLCDIDTSDWGTNEWRYEYLYALGGGQHRRDTKIAHNQTDLVWKIIADAIKSNIRDRRRGKVTLGDIKYSVKSIVRHQHSRYSNDI